MCLPADSDLCNALPVVSDTNHGRGEPSPCVHRGPSGLLLHRACTNPAWTRRISTSRSTSGYSTFASWSTVKVTSVHPEILGQGGEVVVGTAGSALLRAPVFEQRRRQDPAVPAHQPVPDETCIEEFTCGRETLSSPASCWWSAPHARGPRSRLGLPPCSPVPPGSRPVQRRADVPTPRFPPR